MPTIGTRGPAALRRAARIDGRFVWMFVTPAGMHCAFLAREVVRTEVDRDERHLAPVAPQEVDRLVELRSVAVGADPAGDHRGGGLARAAELDEL